MNMSRLCQWLLVPVLAIWLTACGSKEEPVSAPPPPKKPVATAKPRPTPPARPAHPFPTPPTAAEPANTNAAAAADVEPETPAQVEQAYKAHPEFSDRVQYIYQLSDMGTAEALAALGRIFHVEKDDELKVEVLNSLFSIDGLDDKKAVLASVGVSAHLAKDVRLAAIDALADIAAEHSLPILKTLVSDPDEDVRDSAKDTIEQIQTASALQK